MTEPLAEELDELADDPVLSQPLGHGQHQVGGRRAGCQCAVQPDAEHRRDEHRNGLAEHGGLGFDAADAPPHHAETVDHRGVRIGSDERIWIGHRPPGAVVLDDDPCQILEVDLMDDARIGRHDAEVAERVLAPPQE